MNIEYNIKYILSWLYHNVICSNATASIVRVLLLIGLVSLFVYRQFILFILLCIVILTGELFLVNDTNWSSFSTPEYHQNRDVRDELTTGVPIYDIHGGSAREGFSLKIIKGDDSGKDHRRYNKFIEQDSRDFTDKYFKSKQCSIGTGAGGITMFGDNKWIGERILQINGIYDFKGKWVSNTTNNHDINAKRYIYFKDCVYDPIQRYNFRTFKKELYNNINDNIINIENCLKRFNVNILFDTRSEIGAGFSTRLTKIQDQVVESNNSVDNSKSSFEYKSVIAGRTSDDKFSNIMELNRGKYSDNLSESTYSALMKRTNSKPTTSLKQREIDIYGKVYGYRKRLNDILKLMRDQAKDDSANINRINISEEIVQELRTILSYLAIVMRTKFIVEFEEQNGYYNTIQEAVTGGTLKLKPLTSPTNKETITGDNNIFGTPLLDDTFNTNDEKRYLYGITFYFDEDKSISVS
jgi:hypothetical protein